MRIRIRETWLSKKPDPLAAFSMALFLLVMVVFAGSYWENFLNAQTWMAATAKQVFGEHQYWRAWSTLFAHGDGKHLTSNMLLFFVLGSLLAAYFGVLLVPVMAFVFGGLTNLWVLSTMPEEVRLIGASGIVFWMGGAWLTLYLLLDRRRTWVQRSLRAFGVALALFMPAEAFDPTISYQAHFIGFILGVGWGLLYFLVKRKPLRDAEVYEVEVEDEEVSSPQESSSENQYGSSTNSIS